MFTFAELQTLERKTIEVIRTDAGFGRLISLQEQAHAAQVAAGSKAPIDVHLSFAMPTRLREDGAHSVDRQFHVGCAAHASGKGDGVSFLSYSVMISEGADEHRRVQRKFHFDFEPAALRQTEPKPTFHMQICGELSPHHRNAGFNDAHIEHLLPAWSQPRIPSSPMSLALVLHWLFLEFGSEVPVQLARASTRWQSIVRQAERTILKPYYDACFEFFSQNANESNSFIWRRIYEGED